MKRADLDSALESYRQLGLPAAPNSLRQDVWREIRQQQSTSSGEHRWDAFLAWFRADRGLLTSAAMVLAIAISIGCEIFGSQPSHQQQARQALGLNVFSHQSSPLTRLAENP